MIKHYPQSQVLRETLAEWEDSDVAMYKLACSLGILPPEDGSFDGFRACKWVFRSANPLGDELGGFLSDLVACKVLEFDERTRRFRWNPSWDPQSLEER